MQLDPPRYAAFRWMGDGDDQTPSSLNEVWAEDRPGGGVVLRVVESAAAWTGGLATLAELVPTPPAGR